MDNYCIFEIRRPMYAGGHYTWRFIMSLGENYGDAVDMAFALDQASNDPTAWHVVRCLNDEEIKNLDNYSPLLARIFDV